MHRRMTGTPIVGLLTVLGLMAASSAAVASAPPADGGSDGPRARVEFTRTVSGPTPFEDNCVPAGDPLADVEPFVDAEVEPHLSVNPTNPKHLLATWQQDRYPGGGSRSNLAAVSHNGGKSWRSATLPGISSCTGGERTRASDPWTAIGADGTAYVSSFALDAPPRSSDVTAEFDGDTLINRSRTGGATWEPASAVAVDDGMFWHEKAAITADPNTPETLYAVWGRLLMPDPSPFLASRDVAAAFSRSDDGGLTWSKPVALPLDLLGVFEWPHTGVLALPPADEGGPPLLVVVVEATEFRLAPNEEACQLYSTTSSDGGETWTDPVVLAIPPNVPPAEDNEGLKAIRGAAPCLARAASSPNGTAYATWFERTPVGDGPGGTRIMFARSDDAGASWTTGVVAEVPREAYLPTIAVAGDGTVGVTFFDTADDEFGDEELTTNLRFAFSADRGETWEQIGVGDSFDLRTAPDSGGWMLGDYVGLVGLPDGFGALVTLADPIAERGATDIFYARISLDGPSR